MTDEGDHDARGGQRDRRVDLDRFNQLSALVTRPRKARRVFLGCPEGTVRPPGKPERRRCGALLLAGT